MPTLTAGKYFFSAPEEKEALIKELRTFSVSCPDSMEYVVSVGLWLYGKYGPHTMEQLKRVAEFAYPRSMSLGTVANFLMAEPHELSFSDRVKLFQLSGGSTKPTFSESLKHIQSSGKKPIRKYPL